MPRIECFRVSLCTLTPCDVFVCACVLAAEIPLTQPNEYVFAYKTSRRREDDIALVNACFRVRLAPESEGMRFGPHSPHSHLLCSHRLCVGQFRVVDSSIAFGGMNKVPVVAPQTEAFLAGKLWTRDLLAGAYDCLCNVRVVLMCCVCLYVCLQWDALCMYVYDGGRCSLSLCRMLVFLITVCLSPCASRICRRRPPWWYD